MTWWLGWVCSTWESAAGECGTIAWRSASQRWSSELSPFPPLSPSWRVPRVLGRQKPEHRQATVNLSISNKVTLSLLLSQIASSTNTYFVNYQIAKLLQKDHHALWSAVIVGVAPDETECVEKSWQKSVQLWKVPLFQVADQSPQGSQVKFNVLGFQHSCRNHVNRKKVKSLPAAMDTTEVVIGKSCKWGVDSWMFKYIELMLLCEIVLK